MRNYLQKIISKVYNISHYIEQKTYSSLSLHTIVYTIPFIQFLSGNFLLHPVLITYEGRNIKNIPN